MGKLAATSKMYVSKLFEQAERSTQRIRSAPRDSASRHVQEPLKEVGQAPRSRPQWTSPEDAQPGQPHCALQEHQERSRVRSQAGRRRASRREVPPGLSSGQQRGHISGAEEMGATEWGACQPRPSAIRHSGGGPTGRDGQTSRYVARSG